MKVILLKDVRGTGRRSEVKEVSDGYARNFLLPHKLAEMATTESLKRLVRSQAVKAADEASYLEHLKKLAVILKNKQLVLEIKADKDGHTFGSVSKEMILSGLRDAGLITNERIEIDLPQPLKKLGDYEIALDLKKGITAILRIRLEQQRPI